MVTVVMLTSGKTGQTRMYCETDLSQGCDCDSFNLFSHLFKSDFQLVIMICFSIVDKLLIIIL